MRHTRTGIIIVLIGAEIFIAGAILALLGAGRGFAGTSDIHGIAFTPRLIQPIDAGSTPRVQVDDEDSTITVSASGDGRVHVVDNSRFGGTTFGTREPAQLDVEQTSDGVRIARPSSGGTFFMFGGWEDRRIEVQVPAQSRVEITACAGAQVSGLSGSVSVHSTDGAITLSDSTADAELNSDDGHIEASNIRAKRLSMTTSDGELRLRDITVDSLEGSTNDGDITAHGLQVGSGSLHTDDGAIELAFLPTNVSIHAHTNDGDVTFDGRKANSNDDDDSSSGDFHIGSGGGSMQVATQDGDIHILTNGAQ